MKNSPVSQKYVPLVIQIFTLNLMQINKMSVPDKQNIING